MLLETKKTFSFIRGLLSGASCFGFWELGPHTNLSVFSPIEGLGKQADMVLIPVALGFLLVIVRPQKDMGRELCILGIKMLQKGNNAYALDYL